ncbi:MAG: hypothetical protein HC769_08860 [Cyanobacteria bacterium CRU_2_1]|nr:hypothetical protein [Cyanobacteria bacterium RU_5_0]NJR58946.1 hypothetical protein [Cyanobacteria bacterium CRU_2_1]
MNASELRTKVLAEIQRIPEEKLAEVYDWIHRFRVEAETESDTVPMMRFAGCWNDMNREVYDEFINEITLRRQQAFSGRQARETSLD